MYTITATRRLRPLTPAKQDTIRKDVPDLRTAGEEAQSLSYISRAKYTAVGVYDAKGSCILLFSAGQPCL